MLMWISEALATAGVFIFTMINPQHTTPTKCSTKDEVSYCYYTGDPKSEKVIYFLHGFTNNPKAWGWNPVTKRVVEYWKENGISAPHVVSVSLGGVWFYNGKAQGEKLTTFLKDFEKQFQFQPRRTIYGDSMGGHNALRWAMDYPELFPRIAVICPALPHRFIEKAEGKDTGLWPINFLAENLIRDYYAEGKEKQRDLLKQLDNEIYAKNVSDFYIAAVTGDRYGFYDGDRELYRLVQSNTKIKVIFDEQQVQHCNIQAQKLGPFLADELH